MLKKSGYEREGVKNQGLKGPRCTGTCQQTFEKSLTKKATQASGKYDQKIGYRGEYIDSAREEGAIMGKIKSQEVKAKR